MAEETEMSDISMMDISKLKVQDLKKELKLRGLSMTGNKNELAERLQNALSKSEGITPDSVDDLEEDLLNDDDDEHLDASESVILENDLDESPKATKRKIEEITSDKIEVKSAPPKKVILNRHTSIEMTKSIIDSTEKKPEDANINKEEKKVIKLSSLSAKERLEMRAKKFGVTDLSSDAKKIVRAERFGTKNSNSSDSVSNKITVTTSVDVLKQRAERFGGSVSSVMSSMENQEKLEKRKARFGLSTSTNGTAVTDSEKAKQQRLERFKQPVT